MYFAGRSVDAFAWPAGPILQANPHFRALRVSPSKPGELWTYISTGGWASSHDSRAGREFVLSLPTADPRGVELLAMVVFYDRADILGLGHSMPIGEPWLPGSACDHFLLSAPYPFGPQLETCHVGDRHVDFLWLVPITESERRFKTEHGLDALEAQFEEQQLHYWEIERRPIL